MALIEVRSDMRILVFSQSPLYYIMLLFRKPVSFFFGVKLWHNYYMCMLI